MKNQLILLFVLGISLYACTSQPSFNDNTNEKPNIIFIISDDQAYGDYGFMGHEFIQTPHIDQLAKESMTFTRGYTTAPLCSPSLASILTGLYAHQHGITGNDPVVAYDGKKSYGRTAPSGAYLPNSYPVKRQEAYQKLAVNFYKNKLLTQTLSKNGYRSFQTGKWWVGSALDAGFDKGMTHGDYNRGGRHGDEGLKIGREGMQPIYDFIAESQAEKQPFFVWYAPFLPHTPHNPPKELADKYLKIAPSPFIAKYWAMVEWFDQTTGELLNHLKEKGLSENTIIVYTCDNGWIQSEDRRGYAPRSKRSPFEGGIRTPIMFKYPRGIPPKMDSENMVSNVDLIPTVLNLIGIDNRNLPGIDVLDKTLLSNRKIVFSEAYNHDIGNVEAPTETILYKIAIENEWKLMLPNPAMIQQDATTQKEEIAGYYSKEIQLFNLMEDPKELKNVAKAHPAIVQRLTEEINDWWKG